MAGFARRFPTLRHGVLLFSHLATQWTVAKHERCFAQPMSRLARIWADGAYAGELVHWVKTTCDCELEIVKRSDKLKGFQVLPHRWVVERPFASSSSS